MPSKNSKKEFAEDCYYHVYNRGVEKREIFLEDADYRTFIYNIRRYLEKDFLLEKINPKTKKKVLVEPDQVRHKIDLCAFCLMPNHFHLLVRLKTRDGLTDLIRKLAGNYTTYFNEKYGRSGVLFQGIYKAVQIKTEEELNNLSRYIHLNPITLLNNKALVDYEFSSFSYICTNKKVSWLNYDSILGNSTVASYKKFVLNGTYERDEAWKACIKDVSID